MFWSTQVEGLHPTFIFHFESVAERYDWDEEEKLNMLGDSSLDDVLDYFLSFMEHM